MNELRDHARELNALRLDQADARSAYALARDQELRGARGASGAVQEARHVLDQLSERERAILGKIGRASDPQEAVATLKDSDPLLLFPVRLETRFKTIEDGEKTRDELWIRIYPDDCMVDTFEALPSDSEILATKIYWQNIWRAGGDTESERSAWTQLVASCGAGRAAWLIRNYEPVNQTQRRTDKDNDETFLIAATDTAPTPGLIAALHDYWLAVWRANKHGPSIAAARQQLVADLGSVSAAEAAIEALTPFNLKDLLPPSKAGDPPPAADFLVVQFPDSQTIGKQRFSWGASPKAKALPDRFVAIGYDGPPQSGSVPAFVEVGEPIPSPLILGIDPTAKKGEQIDTDNDDLVLADELAWLVDFEAAVAKGMGLKVGLEPEQAQGGFARLLVIGIRVTAEASDGKTMLQELFAHHRDGRNGFALLAQGTPTNNVEEEPADFRLEREAERAFAATFTEAGKPVDAAAWSEQLDGARLAHALGLPIDALRGVDGVNRPDQRDARTMHEALFPGTLGYFLHAMIGDALSDNGFERIRSFFLNDVSGRGPIPAIRIGAQPYGILATTAFSRLSFAGRQLPTREWEEAEFLERITTALRIAEQDWSQLVKGTSWIGQRGDRHRILLDTLGQHPASAEFYRRTAEGIEEHLNRLNLVGGPLGIDLPRMLEAIFRKTEIPTLLARLGLGPSADLPLSEKIFSGRQHRLGGPVIDDVPLSEEERVRDYTTDDRNYLQWLAEEALVDLDRIRQQQGFVADQPPRSLLYIILRFALLSGYRHEATNRIRDLGLITEVTAKAFRQDPAFVHVKEKASESRWAQLYSPVEGADERLHQAIARDLRSSAADNALRSQVRAIEELAEMSTARLERLFVEHVDCLSYRIDAWRTGLAFRRLQQIRDGSEPDEAGILLGAYGWVENLRPRTAPQPFDLPESVAQGFSGAELGPVTLDPANQGFVHAPSLDHAVTAAILRNGHLSMANPDNGEELAINLGSERVRRALAIFQGMSEGQSLAALLGYQIERGLHERHLPLELDKFVQPLRNLFPLEANLIPETAVELAAQESISARNVIDGRKLAAKVHSLATAARNYPYGLTGLPTATPDEAKAIEAEVDRLLDTLDAVSDLALTETVHQAARGNFDRAAGVMDAFSRGSAPPEPEVTLTPRSGTNITHRIAIQLAEAPPPPPVRTPRSSCEPRLDHWLGQRLPPLEDVACRVTFFDAAANAPAVPVRVSIADLKLAPIDLLALAPGRSAEDRSAFDELVVDFVETNHDVAPDGQIEIDTIAPIDDDTITVFELAPILTHLRGLLDKARPLGASDLAPPANPYPDPLMKIDVEDVAIKAQDPLLAGLEAEAEALASDASAKAKAYRDDPASGRAQLVNHVDAGAAKLLSLARRAAFYTLPTAGFATVRNGRRSVFARTRKIATELAERWTQSLERADALLAEEALLAASGGTAEGRRARLRSAEALISSNQALIDPPPDPSTLRPAVETKRDAFATRLTKIEQLATTSAAGLKPLLDEVDALLPLTDFELTQPAFAELDGLVATMTEAIATIALALAEATQNRLTSAQAEIARYEATPAGTGRADALQAAAQKIFGQDFLLLRGVHLSGTPRDDDSGATQMADWTAAIAAEGSGELLSYLEQDLERLDPVDEWLAGIARVRSAMKHLELLGTFSEGFGRTPLKLSAFQVPFVAGDCWLGAEFPPEQDLSRERLLLTAVVPPAGLDATKPIYGLIVDEWVETLPNAAETTGLTFHYDRPNAEPPQTMLLVVPPVRTGAWAWDDIVDAVNETFDLAQQRAVEPAHIDASSYARLLPSLLFSTAHSEVTLVADLALNNLAGFKVRGDHT